jgi:hypothetical protein
MLLLLLDPQGCTVPTIKHAMNWPEHRSVMIADWCRKLNLRIVHTEPDLHRHCPRYYCEEKEQDDGDR